MIAIGGGDIAARASGAGAVCWRFPGGGCDRSTSSPTTYHANGDQSAVAKGPAASEPPDLVELFQAPWLFVTCTFTLNLAREHST